jgi:hypothetical protein
MAHSTPRRVVQGVVMTKKNIHSGVFVVLIFWQIIKNNNHFSRGKMDYCVGIWLRIST